MKRFTKFCLILSGIFVVLGIVGVTAGMALGARPGQFLNVAYHHNSFLPWEDDWGRNRWGRDLDWEISDIPDLDEAEDFYDEDNEEYLQEIDELFENMENGGVFELENRYGDARTRKLDLELTQAVLAVYLHDGEDVLVKARNVQDYLKVREEGDELVLTDRRPNKENALELELYIPRRALSEIELEIGAGVVRAEKLEASEVSVSMGAGEAEIGEIRASHEADVEVGAGEMYVDYLEGGNLDLECGVGALYVTAAGRESDYNYKISGGIGAISIDGEDYSGMGFDHKKDHGAFKTIQLECGVGEISLDFTE